MLKTIHISLLCLVTLISNAQWSDSEEFRQALKTLHNSAKQGFKDIKGEPTGELNGEATFNSTLLPAGAAKAWLQVDSEKSHTYVAIFEFKNVPAVEAAIEPMVKAAEESLAEFSLSRGKGIDMRYVRYQKHLIEFASDNIDETGKRPSFAFGILKDSNPVAIEMRVNEPLWK